MRIPNPIANTTTEAYLAYKAGVLEVGDLKPKLYFPYLHFDAWLAYWAGLTSTYPMTGGGKNLFDIETAATEDYRATATLADGELTVTASTNGTGYHSIMIVNSDKLLGRKCTFSLNGAATQGDGYIRIYQSKSTSPATTRGNSISQLTVSEGSGSVTFTFPESFTTDADCFSILFYPSSALSSTVAGASATYSDVQLEFGPHATSYEPYVAPTPECLTDEEALVAYLSGATDTYPETVKDPEDVRIAGYLRYLVSARFGCPAYPVNNRELYLSMLKPPVVTNDTPSANIYLEDTVKAEFVSLEMFGDTSQQTYTGKNLANWASNGDNGGATITVDGDGYFSVKATSTTTNYVNITTRPSISLPAGTYTFSLSSATTEEIRLAGTYEGESRTAITSIAAGGTSTTFTTTKVMVEADVWLPTSIGSTVNIKIRPMLEKGSTATPFEPYVGGITAPNPDYPQTVHTVTGRQTVTVQGKNLFDKNNANTLNAYFDLTTTTITANPNNRTIAIPVLPNKTYTLQSVAKTYGRTIGFTKVLPTIGTQVSDIVVFASDTNKYTVTTKSDTKYIVFRVFNGYSDTGTFEDTLNSIQLEVGDQATTYEPYQGQSYEINLGKNLFDKSTVTNGYRLGSDGLPYGDAPFSVSGYIPIQAGTTYTYSRKLTTGDQTVSAICYYDASKTFISRTMPIITNHTTSGQVTSPANAVYARIADRTEGLDAYQLEKGSTATTYAPYFEPIELCAIRDKTEDVLYSDKIYKDGQEWYLHKETGKDTLDGSIGVFTKITTNRINVQGFPTISHKKVVGFNGQYCTHYETVGEYEANSDFDTATSGMPNAVGIHPRPGAQWAGGLRIKDSRNLSADSYKTWLGSNPVDFYLVLAEPVDTQITNPALIAQLNALKHGGSEEGSTTITVTAAGDNLPGLLKVEAGTESIS